MITEVIPADEDRHLDLSDRLAAAAAAFFVCGATYLVLWIILWAQADGGRFPEHGFDKWLLSWRLPAMLTAATTLSAFCMPARTWRWFGKVMVDIGF